MSVYKKRKREKEERERETETERWRETERRNQRIIIHILGSVADMSIIIFSCGDCGKYCFLIYPIATDSASFLKDFVC